MAPEILKRGGHGKEVDWWSLGTLLFDMLSGGPPFSQECDKQETITKILHSTITFPKYFSAEVVRLIQGLLKRNPKDRLGCRNDVEDIKNHEFFKINDVNWSDVYNRKMEPPFKPELKSDIDVSCFDSTFTGQQPIMTPDNSCTAQILPDLFQGFSYVAPNVASSLLNDFMTGSSRHSRRRNGSGISGNNINPLSPSSPFLNENDFIDMSCNEGPTVHPITNTVTYFPYNLGNSHFFNPQSSFQASQQSTFHQANISFIKNMYNPIGQFFKWNHVTPSSIPAGSNLVSTAASNTQQLTPSCPIPIPPHTEVRKMIP